MNQQDRPAPQIAIPPDYRPKLRQIQPIPFEYEGRSLVLLQDPQQFSDETLTLTPVAGLLVTLFDGQLTIADICGIMRDQCGIAVPEQDVYQLALELDQRHMLDSTAFRQHARNILLEYRASDRRKAWLANKSYPADRGELSEMLESFFTGESGPGLPQPNGATAKPMIRGAIIPHIDLRSGGPCFAHAYRQIAEAPLADTYVILGTGHALGEKLFCATGKTFETAFGDVPADREFIAQLSARFGEDLCAEELYHRTEHVIEFQAVFLQYLLGGKHSFSIVPLLCSYSPSMTLDAAQPFAERIRRFAAALKNTIAESTRKICVIASVDLAHIGPRYGDELALSPEQLRELESDDQQTLGIAAAGNAAEFTGHLLKDQDNSRRRICGYPCINTMLESAAFANGELLRYDQTQIDDQGSIVTYASMVYR